ncbi:GD13709 [Drosophila simulans]|uniref:GD13709 n=1 Tax=Drosophila simulans TaxID=7240 RepID=B4NVM7_DROSI|nr:GD13709 [Drosophila simulans]
MNLHVAATTTPLPLLMSTSGAMYTAAKAKSSPAVGHRLIDDSSSQQQPSFMSFKLNHDRSLPDTDSTDVDVEDQEADLDGEEHDDHEAEGEEEHDEHDNFEEHARELSNDNDGDIKEHVFPLSDNELHPEVHSIEEVQQQLQQEDADADSAPAPAAAEENESSQHDAEADGEHEQEGAEGETDLENESPVELIKANEPLAMPSSTESPAAASRSASSRSPGLQKWQLQSAPREDSSFRARDLIRTCGTTADHRRSTRLLMHASRSMRHTSISSYDA